MRFVAVMCPEKGVKIASYQYYTADSNTSKYERMLKVLVKADNPTINRNSFKVEDAGLVSYCVEMVDGLRVLHIVVTAIDYPERLANQLTEKLRTAFSAKFQAQYAAAEEDALSKSAKKVFEPICAQFDDPAAADKAAAVQKQAEAVSAVMAENVKVMLDNQASLNEVEDKAHEMRNNAKSFKKTATEVKKQMWYENVKYTIILGVILALVATAIIVPVVMKVKGNEMLQLDLQLDHAAAAPPQNAKMTIHDMLMHDGLADLLIADIVGDHDPGQQVS